MRALLRNHLLHLSCSPARTLLVRLQACELSSSSSSPPRDSRYVRVSVWWDLRSCPVPDDVDPLKVAPAIRQAVRANGIKGPIAINAFGNLSSLPEHHLDTLASSGIQITHFPQGFAGLLHRISLNNYNILLAVSTNAPVLSTEATITWQWYKLLKGENLIGKHFNHPPDDPYGSWYGNFRVPLENPFPAKTKPDSLKMSSKGSSDDDIVGSEDASRKSQERYTTSMNRSAGNDQTTVDDIGTANYESGNFRARDKCVNPTRKEVDDVCHSPYAFQVDDCLVDKKTGGSDETYRKGPTFFGWIRSWWQFWKGNAKSGDSTAHQNKVVNHFEDSNSSELVDQTVQTVSDFEDKSSELDQNAICSGKPELFSSSSVWDDMESFIFTRRGSVIVYESKNREDMARKLRKNGPPVFRSLSKKDILQLLELLISEKKWLEETPTQTFPFQFDSVKYIVRLYGSRYDMLKDCEKLSPIIFIVPTKDGSTESPWEEFGPVSVHNSNQSNLESELSQKAMELLASKCPDYDPIVSGNSLVDKELQF
ncbi:hypothetical protein GmHk_04G011487 [Glycine max]|nr:hypothetical protein GmHk_04G011487 [Glycine max]